MNKINPNIFRDYDIRGIAGKKFTSEAVKEYEKWYGPFPGISITPEIAQAIGGAYGTIIRKNGGKKIVIGHELRPFGEELKKAFIAGVLHTGCNVSDLGVAITPVVYFNTSFAGFDGGVVVTGSHNIYFYNGFKLMKKNVYPIFEKEIQKLRLITEKENFFQDRKGNYDLLDGFNSYKKYILDRIKLNKKFKVVIDSGNGSAGLFAPGIFKDLGCEVIEMYSKPDTSFPNHIPDPQERQYLKELAKRVKKEKADLGVGFDADADRVGFISEKGNFVASDLVLLVFARDVLSRHPGKKIIYDVKCSQLLEHLIPKYGGIPVMYRTGHAPLKAAIRKDNDAIFAGEFSGHFFFVEDYFKIDDGPYSAAKILEIMSRQNGSFSSLFNEIPERISTPEMKLPSSDETKFDIVEKVRKKFSKKYSIITIDGVRFQVSKTGWGLLRASNTAPYLSLRVEGKTKKEVLKIKNILADELEKFPDIFDKLDRKNIATLGRLGWK